ncbi:MAG: hypothetical protein ACI4U5_06010 [Bacilli bacterium]
MTREDQLYRAFKEYRKGTISSELKKERKDLLNSNVEQDVCNSTKYFVNIESDWIESIEKGLEFVEKAIAEERQFIRTNGETVPIEKVKKVSKESVKHLAKHSEYITHLPEDESDDVIPDKIHIVEKLSDYAVYENRFLYMMLCFLRDFIQIRIDKIEEIRRTYEGNLYLNKSFETKYRQLGVEIKLVDHRTNNIHFVVNEKSDKLITRIKNIQQIVNSFLNGHLMKEVSKSPMIKPPVVKTNVLKMNNNFKNALACYEYIASYKGKGYEVEEVKNDLVPLEEKYGDELMEIISMLSFLAYKDGNNIDGYLENEYQKEEERRKILEQKELEERIKRLKKLVQESGQSMEEYMLLLEKRVNALLKDSEELTRKKNEIFLLNKTIEALNQEKENYLIKINELNQTIIEKMNEIDMLNQKYVDDMARVKQEHLDEIARINEAHDLNVQEERQKAIEETVLKNKDFIDELNGIIEGYKSSIGQMKLNHENEMISLGNQKRLVEQKIEELTQARLELEKECEAKIAENIHNSSLLIAEMEANKNKALNEMEEKYNEVVDQNIFYRAELTSIKYKNGTIKPNEDYTSREKFLELEDEFKAFNDYFEKQWSMTKKQIRKQIFNKK